MKLIFISCETNLILNWSEKCALSNHTKSVTITDKKLYLSVITLWTQDNAKLLQQLRSPFKRTVNSNKYQSKVVTQAPNPYLDYLIDPSFQEINRTVHTQFYL